MHQSINTDIFLYFNTTDKFLYMSGRLSHLYGADRYKVYFTVTKSYLQKWVLDHHISTSLLLPSFKIYLETQL
jgi:hypothetical protein